MTMLTKKLPALATTQTKAVEHVDGDTSNTSDDNSAGEEHYNELSSSANGRPLLK